MDKLIAVMQPTYLPWIGYFDLIDQADVFVLLDNVQFEKKSWQQRNRIRTATDLEYVSVPISGSFGHNICDTKLADPAFAVKHLKTIRQNYGKAAFFSKYFPDFEQRLSQAGQAGNIGGVNISLITWLCEMFGIQTPLVTGSSLPVTGKRSALLVKLCRHFNAARYLSTPGAADYLRADRELFVGAGISVWLHNYQHPIYRQVYMPFLPYASAIDLLFNEGPRSLEIIRTGRGPSLEL